MGSVLTFILKLQKKRYFKSEFQTKHGSINNGRAVHRNRRKSCGIEGNHQGYWHLNQPACDSEVFRNHSVWALRACERRSRDASKTRYILIFYVSQMIFSEHRSIVRFIAFIDKHKPAWAMCDMCFIAMEHCAGGTLAQWVLRMKTSGRRTTTEEASVIAAQLISALSFCHIRDLGHFDLKPGNVFLMPDFLEVRLFNAG